LWKSNCQLSKLFVVLTTVSLISIVLLPKSIYVMKDEEEGTVKRITISQMRKGLIIVGYILGAMVVNKMIVKSCNKGRDGMALLWFFLGPLIIALSIFVVLFLFHEKRIFSHSFKMGEY